MVSFQNRTPKILNVYKSSIQLLYSKDVVFSGGINYGF